jgi:sterol desaturase/sphingolipid hydroxylase (fatty acid hydroxylase superfamily)
LEIPDFPDVVNWAVPFFILTMIIEVLLGRFRGVAKYETRDTVASLVMGGGNLAEGIVLGFLSYGALFWIYEELAPFKMGWSLPIFVAAFFLDDLRYYWAHRLGHEVRWFWAAHIVHHSSQHYNLSTALRQTWSNTLSAWFIFRIPLVLLGFHPAVLGFCGSISLVYQYWIHTEAIDKMPRPFEAVMNTPSHHRVHHATNPRYLDSNYAGIFIIWDKIFGSFVPEEKEEPCQYGIVKNLGTFNPLRIAFHELIAIARDATGRGLSLGQRLRYVLGPPGYSHDGSRKTCFMLKADHVRRYPEKVGRPGLPGG